MSASNNDRLGTFLFPSASSQQRADSASTRNKVSLKPGRSLMDWIRLTHSGKDLTGVGGKRLEVTPEELAKHGKADDAWICLKGKVYNVTSYMEFHPGGFDELMRGAGTEATDLFNEVHKWVNFESMLEKCLVGRLSATPAFVLKGRSTLGADLMGSLKAKIKADKTKVSTNPSESTNKGNEAITPKYDWFQTEKSASIVVYTKCKTFTRDEIVIDIKERNFRVVFRIKQMIYILHLELDGDIQPFVNVKIGKNSGCAELLLRKSEPHGMWPDLGNPLESHDTFLPAALSEIHFRSCTLSNKCQVTHDTYLFTFDLPEGTRMAVPVGHHVCAQLKVENMDITRSFTPVFSSLYPPPIEDDSLEETRNKRLHLMIKIYKDGAFTSVLQRLDIGDSLLIGDPSGTFEASKLNECESLVLISAGTGFTPMVKVINQFLKSTQEKKAWCMFFNKTEQDIFWRDQLEKIAEDTQRLEIKHVLSEASEDWTGSKGRIDAALLEAFIPKSVVSTEARLVDLEAEDDGKDVTLTRILICICGPPAFTQSTLVILDELGYKSKEIHAFTG